METEEASVEAVAPEEGEKKKKKKKKKDKVKFERIKKF
jgi:hypothetical protein